MIQQPWERGAPPRDPSWLYAGSGQLRAIWRLLLFATVIAFASGLVSSTLGPLMGQLSAETGDLLGSFTWVELGVVFVACYVVLRHIDRQPWSGIGLAGNDWRAAMFTRGLVLGGAAIGTTATILLVIGAMHFQRADAPVLLDGGLATDTPLKSWLLSSCRLATILAPAALTEELLFRGYLWRVADDAVGTRTALWSTSVAFGAAHLTNPGATVRSILLVTLAGLCLGEVRSRTGSLPAAWMAHFAWNWIMAAVLHVPVSGLPLASPVYVAVPTGPAWLTGGAWGPEGGLVAGTVMGGALLMMSGRSLRARWSTLLAHTGSARSARRPGAD